jgi:hypothetical protein
VLRLELDVGGGILVDALVFGSPSKEASNYDQMVLDRGWF